MLVTARPPRWMAAVVAALGHQGEAIVANGAAVMNLQSNEVYQQRLIRAEQLLAVAEVLRREFPGVKLAVESARGMSTEPDAWPRATDLPPLEVGVFEGLRAVTDGQAFKVLAHAEGHGGADAMIARIAPLLSELVEPSHSGVNDSMLEFSPQGVSKASTLERFAARRGIAASEVIAFGDAPNDIPMLAWAGTSYAMGGGHRDAKAAATHVAKRSEEDGVAQILEEIFGL